MIDAQGRVAAHTGAKNIQAAGHIVRHQLLGAGEPDAERHGLAGDGPAFESAKGDLADRMLAALDAAQAAGGDIRGRQSAALIVVTGKPTGKPWADRVFDLRVDDNPEPLKELRRLLVAAARLQPHERRRPRRREQGQRGALREYSAAATLVPDNLEMVYWHAVALVNMGRVDQSLPLFRRVFRADKNWLTLTPRLAKVGLLPSDQQILGRILKSVE